MNMMAVRSQVDEAIQRRNAIQLTSPQTSFFTTKAKFPLFCGGFGSGKSEALFIKLLQVKLAHPRVDVGYFAPSYQLIRDIAYGRIQNLLDRMRLSYNLNKTENNLYIQGYGRILFRTLEVPERIVGYELFAAFLDEIDTMRPKTIEDAWNKVLARTRQIDPDNPNAPNAIYSATTPEGYGFCYNRWKKNATSRYVLYKAPTSSNPHLPPEYIEDLRATYPANLINAYLEGEFVNLVAKTIYSNFDRNTHHTTVTVEDGEPLMIGMDFNVRNMSSIVHVQRDGIAYAVDEFTGIKDTPSMCETISFEYGNHPIIVFPDASGKKNNTTDASVSDLSILRQHGFTLRYKNKNPNLKDRIICMQSAFMNGNSEIHYYVNTDKCPEFTEALEQQTYDDYGRPYKDPTNNIDDLNDAAGYYISHNFPVKRQKFGIVAVAR